MCWVVILDLLDDNDNDSIVIVVGWLVVVVMGSY